MLQSVFFQHGITTFLHFEFEGNRLFLQKLTYGEFQDFADCDYSNLISNPISVVLSVLFLCRFEISRSLESTSQEVSFFKITEWIGKD